MNNIHVYTVSRGNNSRRCGVVLVGLTYQALLAAGLCVLWSLGVMVVSGDTIRDQNNFWLHMPLSNV